MSAKLFDEDEGKSVADMVWSELERDGLSLPGSSIRKALISSALRRMKHRANARTSGPAKRRRTLPKK